MADNVFTLIYDGMIQGFGFEWIVYLFLFLAVGIILFGIIGLDPIFMLLALAIPFSLFAIYQALNFGWGLGVAVVLLGVILALALAKIIFR